MPATSTNKFDIDSPYGVLHCQQYGTGSKVLLVFHGFGQDHSMAAPIADLLGQRYTIFSFDLPYHNLSIWKEKEFALTKNNIGEIFSTWLKDHNINNFSVLGYSMGGKFALTLSQQFPQQTTHCILIAPDGIHKGLWYRVVVSFPIKHLFKRVIYRPTFFFAFTRFLSKTKLVATKLIEFGESQMATDTLRKQVYYTWVNLRKLYTQKHELQNLTEAQSVKLFVILGGKDRVVNPKTIGKYLKEIGVVMTVLPTGHGRLLQEMLPLLNKYLLK